jgi:hypothetical protein
VIVHARGTTRVFDGRGNELSDGGMALTAWAELQPGSEIDIEFTRLIPVRQSALRGRYAIELDTDTALSFSPEVIKKLNELTGCY